MISYYDFKRILFLFDRNRECYFMTKLPTLKFKLQKRRFFSYRYNQSIDSKSQWENKFAL